MKRFLELFALFIIVTMIARAQIAAPASSPFVTLGLAAGQHLGIDAAATSGQLGVDIISRGSAWHAAATYRLMRIEGKQLDGMNATYDLGGTVLYGYKGAKAAAVGGLMVGSTNGAYGYVKAAIGSYHAITVGGHYARFDGHATIGNYLENSVEVGYLLPAPGGIQLAVGDSSLLGLYAQVSHRWVLR